MSITLKTMVQDGIGTEAKVIWIDTIDDYKMFQNLVQRATNLWPDAPAEVKRFADMVTVGKVQQEYVDDPIPFTYPKDIGHGILSESLCNHLVVRSVESPHGSKYCLACKGIFSPRTSKIVYHPKAL